MDTIEEVDWAEARAALDREVDRVVALLRTVRHPEAPALGSWNVAEVATHLSHAYELVPALARRDRASLIAELAHLEGLTTKLVAEDAERDLGVLADRIEASAERFLTWSATVTPDPDDPSPWMVEGTRASVCMSTCHLLNEAVIHGYDIARADGQPWKLDRRCATLVYLGFLLPVFRAVPPTAMIEPGRGETVQATFEIHLRGAGRFRLVFDKGTMRVEPPSSRRVDCHLSVDPAAFLLVSWNRVNQWRAIPKGQLLTWGRRPWLALQLRSFVKNP